MAYYYDQDGNKIPVDDHSTPEEKDKASAQEQANARATNGDTSAGGDAGGVQNPNPASNAVDNSSKVVDGPTGNTQGTANNPQQRKDAAAAAEADRARNAHFQYGGWAGGASEAAGRYAGLGAAAQGRQGAQLALGAVNDDRNASAQARGDSMSMAQLLQARANGSMPSISGMRADQDIGRALADQSSIAASARGPGGLALAQQQQANNSAAAMGNISNTAQINGAQEQLNNTVAAGQAYNTIRGGDQSLMGADTGISVAQAQLNQNQAAENDKYQLGMTGYETGVQQSQLQAQQQQAALAQGATIAGNSLNQQASQFNRSNAAQYIAPAIGGGVTVGGLAALQAVGGAPAPGSTPTVGQQEGTTAGPTAGVGTDQGENGAPPSGLPTDPQNDPNNPGPFPYANGGPFDAGRPILVGERGPEIIMPKRDGYVLTAEQTRAIAPTSRADAFLDGIHPLSYHYKQADAEPRSMPTGGRYLGISAQDLEAVPEVGHQMVSEGPHGKQIEMGPTLSAALAGMARLHERLKSVEGGNEHLTSDMAAKTDVAPEGAAPYVDPRAKAWDEGHNAALDKVQQYRQMSPDELRALGERGNRLANAVRGAKADAYDEARGISQHIMQQAPPRQMETFKRGDDADMSRQPPATLASLYQGGR